MARTSTTTRSTPARKSRATLPAPKRSSSAPLRHDANRDDLGIAPDTTQLSFIHSAFTYDGQNWGRNAVVYLATIASTFGLMAVVAVAQTHSAAIFRDWAVVFAFLVSFPAILFFVASDQDALNVAMHTVRTEGVISQSKEGVEEFRKNWKKRFRKLNLSVQILGLLAAFPLSDLTADAFEKVQAQPWRQVNTPGSYAYEVAIAIFYALLMAYIVRSVAMALLLKGVAKWKISIQPLHPDGCGGLQPLGRIGLRNQYALTILGINIAVLAATLHKQPSLELAIVVPALAIYLIFGPIIFLGPLLPFRRVMGDRRRDMMQEIAAPLDAKFDSIKEEARVTGAVSKQELDALERLRAIGKAVGELPIWPFDARTMRVFATAYVIPILLAIATKVAEVVVDHVST